MAPGPDPLARLRDALAELRQASALSLNEIVARTNPTLGKTTVHAVLACERRPTPRTLQNVVTALGGDPERFRAFSEAASVPVTTAADIEIRADTWVSYLEHERGLPEKLLRLDPAQLPSKMLEPLFGLLRNRAPGTTIALACADGRIFPVTSPVDLGDALIAELVLRRDDEGPRRWLLNESYKILKTRRAVPTARLLSVWDWIAQRRLLPTGQAYQPELLDRFVGAAFAEAGADHNRLFELFDHLLSVTRPDAGSVRRVVDALERHQAFLGDTATTAMRQRIQHLIGKGGAVALLDGEAVPPFEPDLIPVTGGRLCPYEFKAMRSPLTVANMLSIVGEAPAAGANLRLPYVFDDGGLNIDSSAVIDWLAFQVTTIVNACNRQERQDGLRWGVPTVAEWLTLAGCEEQPFPWGRQPPTEDLANLAFGDQRGGRRLRPVGVTPAGQSRHGAQDCCGNVHEVVRTGPAGEYPNDYRLAGACYKTAPDHASCHVFRRFVARSGVDRRRNVGLRLIRYRDDDAAAREAALQAFRSERGFLLNWPAGY